jgi:pimeloyl-ACP methyl ester carboxylesterase
VIRQTAAIVAALVLAGWSLWVLEGARSGLSITHGFVADTPVTTYRDGSGGPVVVIAHGFAGSSPMMMGYATSLAQAGYTVHAFDFLGHGRHTVPMGGDVNSLDGTTRRLVDQTLRVIAAVRDGPEPVALLGHSMATDILVRVADEAEGIGPLVLISAFSQAIDADTPSDMLLITGVWEPGLRGFAREAVGMVAPGASEGETVTEGTVRRRAVVAPFAEHVAVLHSRAGRAEAVEWLNGAYGRDRTAPVPPTGWAVLGLLAAITLIFAPLARLTRARAPKPEVLRPLGFAAVVLVPALIVPPVASLIETRFLPVLIADYLALHLALYGLIQGAILVWLSGRSGLGQPSALAVALIVIWGLGVFGLALDRYGASFLPNAPRIPIIAALLLGAVPFMLADARLVYGAGLGRRVLARLGFLASLGAAVALDFEELFFLIMIAPVIVLFWLTYGTMGRWIAARTGPLSAGLGLGIVLAWALGVSFPLFEV